MPGIGVDVYLGHRDTNWDTEVVAVVVAVSLLLMNILRGQRLPLHANVVLVCHKESEARLPVLHRSS